MLRLILSRLIQLPIILLVILTVSFTMAWVMPGDPFNAEGAKKVDESVKLRMEARYNMDKGPVYFFGSYVEGIVTRGDFGESTASSGRKVADIIKDGFPVSASLGLCAIAVGLIIGTTAGVLGSLQPRSPFKTGSYAFGIALLFLPSILILCVLIFFDAHWFILLLGLLIGLAIGAFAAFNPQGTLDTGSLAVTLIGISLPSFVTGAILLAVGASLTRLYLPNATWTHFPLGGWSGPKSMILPAIALGLAPAAYIARLIRLGLADIMSSDFVRTARAKGLSHRDALFKHALKVAFLPVLSFLGPAAASVMTGSFVVEKIFNIPGIGQEFVYAVQNKDQMVILGVVLVFATMLIVFNLLVDLAYAWVDPRIDLS